MPLVQIPGENGKKIELRTMRPEPGRERKRALVLHQHPAFGGSMDDQTLYRVYYSLLRSGFEVVRFNFRGCGRSTGTFGDTEEGQGEVSDANDVLDWVQEQGGPYCPVMVVGFGYGAWIGAQVSARRPEVTDAVLVSPEPNLYDFSFMTEFCPASSLVVWAGSDAVVPRKSMDDMEFALRATQHGRVDWARVEGASHTFDRGAEGLLGVVSEYVARRFQE